MFNNNVVYLVSLTGSPKVATAPNLGARLSMQFAANGAHSG